MATNKSKRNFVLDSYTLCLCWIHCFISHLIYLSFNQTHNAAILSSKCETFVLQIHHTKFCWTFFSCWRWNLVLVCQFTVVHFNLISNIFLCRYESRNLRMKLLTWCRVISRSGLGLKFVKIFRTCIQNFFITLRVTIFFFRDVDLLC